MSSSESRGASAPLFDLALREYALVPLARALFKIGYFALEVEGAEHVPADGRAVFAANHAGWFPLDAFFLSIALSERLGPERAPVFAAADAALAAPVLGPFLRAAGALPASHFRRPERLPAGIGAVGIFPEGVAGNTKPFWKAYQMARWNRGFIRVAAALDAPIVPVAIVGGEECVPVAWTVKALEPWVGSIFGLPLSPIPLPTRWKVTFHAPVAVEGGRAALTDPDRAAAQAARIQGTVARTLARQARKLPLAKLSFAVATGQLGRRLLGRRRRAERPLPARNEPAGAEPAPGEPRARPRLAVVG